MSNLFQNNFYLKILVLNLLLFVTVLTGCAVAAKENVEVAETKQNTAESQPTTENLPKPEPKTSIKLPENLEETPAGMIMAFYKALADKRFRDMFMMTNLKLAVEGLTDAEMKDLQPDFEMLIEQVSNVEIAGEQTAGQLASVMVKSFDAKLGREKVDIINLRRDGNKWVIILDLEAEQAVKQHGKNYFFNLRIDTHHEEAQNALRKFIEAQMIHSMQYGGVAGNLKNLTDANLIDLPSMESIGYKFTVDVSKDGKKYYVNAYPAQYGRTGKLSYYLEGVIGGQTKMKSEDKKGQPIKN